MTPIDPQPPKHTHARAAQKEVATCGSIPVTQTSAAALSRAHPCAHHGARPRSAGPARWGQRTRKASSAVAAALTLQVRKRGLVRDTATYALAVSAEGRNNRARPTVRSLVSCSLDSFCMDRRSDGGEVGPTSIAAGTVQYTCPSYLCGGGVILDYPAEGGIDC